MPIKTSDFHELKPDDEASQKSEGCIMMNQIRYYMFCFHLHENREAAMYSTRESHMTFLLLENC